MTDATVYLGKTREDYHRALCHIVCRFVGIEPIDSNDGSPNWWAFTEDVERLMSDLEKRGWKFGEST